MNTKLTEKEKQLSNKINSYRKSMGLKPLSVSKSLTFVARTHVKDSNKYYKEDQKDSRGIIGNLHSWSNHGNWKPVVYTDDHKYADLMWSKPAELTNYKGYGFEIAAMSYGNISPDEALQMWKNSQGHNDVIIGRGNWAKLNVMGIAIDGNFAYVWFGMDYNDPAGYHITY